jgi:hypothetical protein
MKQIRFEASHVASKGWDKKLAHDMKPHAAKAEVSTEGKTAKVKLLVEGLEAVGVIGTAITAFAKILTGQPDSAPTQVPINVTLVVTGTQGTTELAVPSGGVTSAHVEKVQQVVGQIEHVADKPEK